MLNKVILMGRLTKDPEIKYTQANNTAVCSFTLAVDRGYAKPGEERQADFISIVAWRNTAEFCSKYFTKGQLVAVAGRLQTRSWDDTEGKKHYATEVIADEVHFAEKKRDDAGFRPDAGYSRPEGQRPIGDNNQRSEGFYPIDNDDELPF